MMVGMKRGYGIMVLMVVWVTTQRDVALYHCMDHGIG